MEQKRGWFGTLVRLLLLLLLAAFGILAFDVWQLRALRPPDDRSFEGFVRAGRSGTLLIDAPGDRLYWISAQKTVVPYSEPVVYEFGRTGELLNWTPGTDDLRGMIVPKPVRRNGTKATLEEARSWLRPKPTSPRGD